VVQVLCNGLTTGEKCKGFLRSLLDHKLCGNTVCVCVCVMGVQTYEESYRFITNDAQKS